MSDTVIRVENLSKLYHIGRAQEHHDTLRDALMAGLRAPLAHLHRNGHEVNGAGDDRIWALKDVSFEVKRGEVVGIIGRNGAGKSTLLKILSQITEPTSGYAEMRGRVGSLLEVGTGFHPELTGRENIYLNGAILGMRRSEVERKFDEIVAFAEIEKFLDTPVKRYSSGMYVRLAFAVAAHLEPEILLVDEVLAVGDAAFQKKCLGKMGDVAQGGRTILFVSHNMAIMQVLCQHGLFLSYGAVFVRGRIEEAVTSYLQSLEQNSAISLSDRSDRYGKGLARLNHIEILNAHEHPVNILSLGAPAHFVFHLDTIPPSSACVFTLYDEYGQPIASFDSAFHTAEDSTQHSVGNKFICSFDELLLVPGRYRMNVMITSDGEVQDHVSGAFFFEVEEGQIQGRPVMRENGRGGVFQKHRWTLSK